MSTQAIVGLSISGSLCILGLVYSKSKILSRIMLLWMLVLVCCNTGGSDWINNYSVYRDANFSGATLDNILTFGFTAICTYAKESGISFEALHFILGGIATLLIYQVIKRYSENTALVTTFIMLYPFVDNIIQKRWYYAMSIIIFGLPILWEEKEEKKKWIKFFLICFTATQFHIAALFFAFILAFELISEKYRWKLIAVAFVTELFVVRLLSRTLVKYTLFESKATLYLITFAKNSTLIKFLFWTAWHITVVFLSLHVGHLKLKTFDEFGRRKRKKKRIGISEENLREHNFKHAILILNLFSLLVIPFYMFDPVFTRLFRPIVILNYILISNNIYSKYRKFSEKGFLNKITGICVAVSSFIIFYFLTGAGFDQLVVPLLDNNSFLNLLF